MAVHKLRSLGASILLILLLGVLSYILLTGQYEESLGKYQTQGDRAYVLAFIDLFLYGLLSTSFLLVALPLAFLLGLVLLRNWKDGLLTGLMSGVVVSLLSLYFMKTYFPEDLAAGGIAIVLQRVWQGSVNGLIIGAPGAFGGSLGAIGGFLEKRRIARQLATKRPYKCPKCGVEFESNPEICSNCGKRIRRSPK